MTRYPIYRGTRLHPNSHAFALYEAHDFKALDQHMARLEREAHERGDVPLQPITPPKEAS